ncbi:MAG: NUDIX hydrolase [Deltaproteobacteria bacterium]|nr:NUDIX hydrolase [Deltaproteobacteria bacterium]
MELNFSRDKTAAPRAGAAPLPASTVILMRDGRESPFEVLLMRRHHQQSFMSGAYVFPGGRVDDDDRRPDPSFVVGRTDDQVWESFRDPNLDHESALGYYLAAVRETFEEAGVLLADRRNSDNRPLSSDRLASYRAGLHDGRVSLEKIAVEAGVQIRLDWLLPYSHWITPEAERKRFDTRFFLARLPEGQETRHDEVEMSDSLWVTPREAINGFNAGRIILVPPTLVTLEELAEMASIEQAIALAGKRRVYPILPQAFMDGSIVSLKLPHDPEYSIEAFRQPPRPDEISRLKLVDGRWQTVKVDRKE